MDALVTYLLAEKGLHDSPIVEVGCGKGYFLRKLVEDEKANNTGYGFDPSYQGPEVDCGGRLHFNKHFYDSASVAMQQAGFKVQNVRSCRPMGWGV